MVNASRPSAISCCPIVICLVVFASFGLVESPASASASEGPVAAYSFDEGEGTSAEDVTGDGHVGTIEGASWGNGKYGSALKFDGENDCVTVPESPDFELTEEFTLEAWVKPEGSLGEDPVISKQAEGEDSYGFGIAFFAGGKAEGFIGEGEEAYKYVSSSEAIEPKAWTHLAFTYDGAHMRIYVNGELTGTHAMSQAPLPSSGPLTIGCDEAFGEHFQGRIDEVRVYDRALDEAEVAADKSAPIQTPQAGPVAAYSFDEGEGETAEDVTGNGHTATLEGATWARGRYGDGLEFNGTSSCVSIAAASDLQLTEEFTLEAWVRPVGAGEEANPFLTMEDEGAAEEEEPFAYTFLAGENEVPKAWVRKSGESGFQGIYGTEPLPEHAWAHLALTDDGAKLRLYVDGELVRTTAAPEVTSATGPLTIGCDKLFPAYFEGRIDEVRIYNRVLEEGEVQTDRAAPIQTPSAGPVAAYSFDEGEGETAEDVTGNGHTATLEGATWARGKYGDGLSFDGTSSCVSIAATSDLQFTEEFTLEAWVRPEGEGEEALPVIAMLDSEAGPSEEEFAYELLAGQKEVPKGWVRKGGSSGFQSIAGTEALPEKAWDHISLTDDGAHLRLYVNGELVRTTVAPNLTTASGPLQIGCEPYAHFKGRIDEVRIYNRVLDEGEVQGDKSAPIQTPSAGPVAAYSFDEGEGETAEDVTGNAHTATLEGATWARGRYGDGLEFNGTSSCVSIAAASDLQLTEEFTLEAWVRPTGSGSEANPFLTMEDEGAAEEEEPFAYTFLAGEHEVPKAWVRKSGEAGFQGIYGTEPLPEHAWAHLALTDDGAKLRLYVNGELVRTTAAPEVTAATGPFTIGCDKLFPAYFEGRIDEVRIYNRVLDEGEVQGDKSAPIQTPQQGPVAAYSFDEGEGETVEDITGNGHDGTIEGAEWTVRGKYGSALKFDGENDCVAVPESSELDFSEEFTIESWVKPEGELHHDPILFKEGEGFPSYALGVGIPHSGKAEGVIGQEGEGHESVYSGESLEAKVWSHLALTYDGAKLRLYVNGELVAIEAVENADSGSPGPLTIGCDALYGNYFQGRIDELRIYNRALSEIEIRQTAAAALPIAVTETATEMESNSAILRGTVAANGGETEYYFEYGPTKSYGSIAMGEELDNSREEIHLSQAVVELTPEATYHYRLVADGPTGTNYGKDMVFTTTSRTMTVTEEQELKTAEESSTLTATASKAGRSDFYGMMWSGDLQKMQSEHIYEAIERSGAKMLLLPLAPGPQSVFENALAEAAAHHLTVLPGLGAFAFPREGTAARKEWVKYAGEVVERYGPGTSSNIRLWQIWNEPNMEFSSSSEYLGGKPKPRVFAKFFKEMAEGMREASSEVKILSPSMYGYRAEGCHPSCHQGARQFLEAMDEELKELNYNGEHQGYDAISLHPYVFEVGRPHHKHAPVNAQQVKDVKNEIRSKIAEVHSLHVNKPIWVTELGFPVANPAKTAHVPPVSPLIQRSLVKSSFTMMQNNRDRLNIAHAFYYNIQDAPSVGTGWEYYSGLLDVEKDPRPAWGGYSELAGGQSCPFAAEAEC